MEFLLGVIVGAIAMFWLFFWLGTSPRFKKYDQTQGPVWHPNGEICKDGHEWCQEHAEQGKFHCNKCPYVMRQGE